MNNKLKFYQKYIDLYTKYKKNFQEFGFIISTDDYGTNENIVVFQTGDNKIIKFKLLRYRNIPEGSFTYDVINSDPMRILIIDNIEDFDYFTNKYADLYEFNETIFIKWDETYCPWCNYKLRTRLFGGFGMRKYYREEAINRC